MELYENGLTFGASPTWQFEQFDCVFVFKKYIYFSFLKGKRGKHFEVQAISSGADYFDAQARGQGLRPTCQIFTDDSSSFLNALIIQTCCLVTFRL